MTYRQLGELIAAMPEDRKDDAATVYVGDVDEFYAVAGVRVAKERSNDVLDPGHHYLTTAFD